MAQDDKDKPPFGAKSFNEVMDEHAKAAAEARQADAEEQARQASELQLWDAEEQSKKLQPTYVNRCFVKIENRNLRISFGDRVGEEDIYRLSIVMTPEDAYEVGRLLMNQAGAAYGMTVEHYRQILESLAPKAEPNG